MSFSLVKVSSFLSFCRRTAEFPENLMYFLCFISRNLILKFFSMMLLTLSDCFTLHLKLVFSIIELDLYTTSLILKGAVPIDFEWIWEVKTFFLLVFFQEFMFKNVRICNYFKMSSVIFFVAVKDGRELGKLYFYIMPECIFYYSIRCSC